MQKIPSDKVSGFIVVCNIYLKINVPGVMFYGSGNAVRKNLRTFAGHNIKLTGDAKIKVQGSDITVLALAERDYISLTDMAGAKDGDSRAADIIKNWMRNRYTIEFLGTWEMIHWSNLTTLESRQVCQVSS